MFTCKDITNQSQAEHSLHHQQTKATPYVYLCKDTANILLGGVGTYCHHFSIVVGSFGKWYVSIIILLRCRVLNNFNIHLNMCLVMVNVGSYLPNHNRKHASFRKGYQRCDALVFSLSWSNKACHASRDGLSSSDKDCNCCRNNSLSGNCQTSCGWSTKSSFIQIKSSESKLLSLLSSAGTAESLLLSEEWSDQDAEWSLKSILISTESLLVSWEMSRRRWAVGCQYEP